MTSSQLDQAVASLGAGKSLRETAKTLGVVHTTLARRMATPEFSRRVTKEKKRIRDNAGRAERRVEDKRSTLPGAQTPEMAPELQRRSPVPPPRGTPEREAWDAATSHTDSRPGGIGAKGGSGSSSRSRKSSTGEGGRLIPFHGPTIFDGPVAMEQTARFGPGPGYDATPRDWLEARSKMRTYYAPEGGRTLRVQPGSEDEADCIAFGWRCAP